MNIKKQFKTVWDEDTRMPWGKHKGERLGDIPEKYLAWLYAQSWIHNWEALSDYIEGLDLESSHLDERDSDFED